MSNETNKTDINDIETKLKDLKDSLENTEKGIKEQTNKRDILKVDVADLEKKLSEIKQVKDAYKKVYLGFDTDKTGLDKYATAKKKVIDEKLQDPVKSEIDKKIIEVDDDIKSKKDLFENLKGEYEKAKTNFEVTKRDLEDKQAKFDSFKALQKNIDDCLKKLKTLKDSIEKEYEKGSLINTYFLFKEFENKLGKCTLKDEDTFSKELNESWQALDKAKLDHRNNEEIMNEAKVSLDNSQKEYESLSNSRNDNILNEISNIKLDSSQKESDSANTDNKKKPSDENSGSQSQKQLSSANSGDSESVTN